MYWQLSSYYLLDQLKMRESQDDVVSRLIIEGSYCLILTKIFINLDQQTIVECYFTTFQSKDHGTAK